MTASANTAGAGVQGGGLVLVVDDDDALRETTIEILVSNGCRAIGARSVAEALSLQAVLDPDVVLADYQLPTRSGLDLARELKAADPDLPVLMLTGHSSMATAVEGVRYLDEYLTKPTSPDVLLRAVGVAVQRRRLVLENRGLVARLRDFTAHQALHDPLTGLPNRALFLDRLQQALALAARHGSSVAVMFIDVDEFKTVNDTMGHEAGDQLLVAVAERLGTAIRSSDTLARFGGDEFTVLCADMHDEAGAARVAQQVLELFATPLPLGPVEHYVSVSIGVSVCGPRSAPSRPEVLLRNADTAMYQAKGQGKARWVLFDDAMRERVVQRFGTERALRTAVTGEQLRVHYQPEVDLRSGRIIGAEALVRWQHPQRGELLPEEFIGLAEESPLILQLGEWVLEKAVAQARRWRDAGDVGEDFTVWVNCSPRQLCEPRLPELARDLLSAAGLPPGALGLEVTESGVVDNLQVASGVLGALKAAGVRLAIDDFGTGYATMTWLQRLPIDALKIDRSFVAGLGGGPKESAIVQALIALGHALGLQVVAEGVETEAQLVAVHELGCDVAQGFYLGRPAPARSPVQHPQLSLLRTQERAAAT